MEPRLGRPDLRLQPRRQLEVVPPAAEQGHRGMGVQVHESWERDLPFPVDHRVRFALLTDLDDPVSLDVHLGDVAFDLDIADQDAHRNCSNAFATTVRVRSAFCRCVSRIFSNVNGSPPIPLQELTTVPRDARGVPRSEPSVASDAIVNPTTASLALMCAAPPRVSGR